MIILYLSETCGYCMMLRSFMTDHDIEYVERDIADDSVEQELITRGGRRQVPYMIDEERNVEMYEEKDIRAYMKEHYVTR